jgi:hypothetical protein
MTVAIIDDSYSNEHLDSSTDTSHAGSTLKTTRLIRVIYSGIFGEGLETARNSPFTGIHCRSSMPHPRLARRLPGDFTVA